MKNCAPFLFCLQGPALLKTLPVTLLSAALLLSGGGAILNREGLKWAKAHFFIVG